MVHFYGRCSFFSGIIFGVILALLVRQVTIKWDSQKTEKKRESFAEKYEKWGLKRNHASWNTLESLHKEYLLESQFLFKTVKVLCIILTKNESNLNAPLATWARGCNDVKIVILHKNKGPFPSMKIVKENSSWWLLCSKLKDVNLDSTDWVFIANEYTFAILENFRYYVAAFDPQKPFYLGHAVKFWSTIYNTKHSAYALNKNAIKILHKRIHTTDCSAENAYLNKEDFYMGKTLGSMNVTPVDTRDDDGFSLFYPNTWEQVLFPSEGIFQSSLYPIKCCSTMSIAFQTNNNNKMFTFYYLLYNLQLFFKGNLRQRYEILQNQHDNQEDDLVWKNFLKSQNISYDVSNEQYFKIWEKLILDPNSPWHLGPTDKTLSDYEN